MMNDPKLEPMVVKKEKLADASNTAQSLTAKTGSSEQAFCDICFSNPKNIAFIPCGHVR